MEKGNDGAVKRGKFLQLCCYSKHSGICVTLRKCLYMEMTMGRLVCVCSLYSLQL